MRKIEYKNGDQIGECIYLHDVVKKNNKRRALFMCMKCNNRTKFEAYIADVKRLDTKSCGCIHSDIIKGVNSKHGMSGTSIYHTWKNIKRRCFNKNCQDFKHYGGRGIKVCEEWSNSFICFFNHVSTIADYGKDNMTLDRINNDGNYEPNNVRWATMHIQVINQRRQKSNTSGFIGVSYHKLAGKWAAYIGVHCNLLYLGLHDTPQDAVKARNDYIIDNGLLEYQIQEII